MLDDFILVHCNSPLAKPSQKTLHRCSFRDEASPGLAA
jgi:hypothetical protein